jgi:hypothetical protein
MAFRHSFLVLAFALLTASGFAGAPASAQSAADQQAAVSQEDLKTFAGAAQEVQRINQTYLPTYQSAQTDQQRQAIEKEAMSKMAEAVQQKGLTIEKYNQIVQLAQSDPEVARKVDEYSQQTPRQ